MIFWDMQWGECKKSCSVCGGIEAPAQIEMADGYAGEALERDPGRYHVDFPAGAGLPGPHRGFNRIIL